MYKNENGKGTHDPGIQIQVKTKAWQLSLRFALLPWNQTTAAEWLHACTLHIHTKYTCVSWPGCQKSGLAKTGPGGLVPPPLKDMVGKLTDRNRELDWTDPWAWLLLS